MADRHFDASACVYAHRGLWTRETPENSLAAFRAAAAAAIGVELDVRLTADRHPVVFHDATLDRMCGVSGRLDQTSWTETLHLRLPDGSAPPHLLEVLDLLREVPVLIELKVDRPGDTQIAEIVSAAVEQRAQPLALMSFDVETVRLARQLRADRPVGLLVDSPRHVATDEANRLTQIAEGIGCDFVGPNVDTLSALQAHTLSAVTWTIRDPSQLQPAIAHQAAPIFEGFAPEIAIAAASRKGLQLGG